MTNKLNRPLGITFIAVVTIIFGILYLLIGFGSIVIGTGAIFSHMLINYTDNSNVLPPTSQIIENMFITIGIILLIIGIIYIIMSFGLVKGKGWSWTITVILIIMNLAISIIPITIGLLSAIPTINNDYSLLIIVLAPTLIDISISIIILCYFYRPHVKVFFGKS
jgi:hypothetical protein